LDTVKSKFIDFIFKNGRHKWSLKEDTPNMVTFTRPCGAEFMCSLTQVLIGNSKSTPLQIDTSANFLKTPRGVKIYISKFDAWTQMPFGQINHQDMLSDSAVKTFQEQLNNFAKNTVFEAVTEANVVEKDNQDGLLMKRMRELNQMRDEKMITQDEFDTLRAKLLNSQ